MLKWNLSIIIFYLITGTTETKKRKEIQELILLAWPFEVCTHYPHGNVNGDAGMQATSPGMTGREPIVIILLLNEALRPPKGPASYC